MARRDLTGAVDFSVLEGFTGPDLQAAEEVLNLFREQADVWSRLLEPHVDGWRDAAHTVKGAAAGIGARELASACADAEAAPEELAGAALVRVKDALDRALVDVAAYLHERTLQSLKSIKA